METIDRILLWFGIHTATSRDASNKAFTVRGSIRRIFGKIGPSWALTLDGRRGEFHHANDICDSRPVFVPGVATRF